ATLFSAISRNAAGTSSFGRSNFGISNLGSSNRGTIGVVAAFAFGFAAVLVVSVIGWSSHGRKSVGTRTPPPGGPIPNFGGLWARVGGLRNPSPSRLSRTFIY